MSPDFSANDLGADDFERSAASGSQVPTEVVLTDWLQFLRAAFTAKVSGRFKPKVGIVVSAWDALPTDQQDIMPMDYLAQNFPLLSQFVETNGDRFEFQTFGLSILSGDLKQDDVFRKAFVEGRLEEFGYVIHSLNGSRQQELDVTVPVAWTLGWHTASFHKEST